MMMASGLGSGMLWGSLIGVFLLLGFAYLIWVAADKESGAAKSIGQVIAVVVAVLAVALILYGGIYSGMMGQGWCDRSNFGKRGWSENKMHERMERLMENEGMHEWMEEYLKKTK